MNKLGRLGRSIPQGNVRVGVVTHSWLETWQRTVIDEMRADPAICLDSWFVLPGNPDPQPPFLAAKYVAWSSRAGAPQALVDGSKCGSGIERVEITVEGSGEPSQATRSKIAAHQLDVLLWLDDTRPTGECHELARFGVWAFSLGAPSTRPMRPAYFAEAYRGDLLSEVFLLCHRKTFDTAVVLDRHSTATQQGLNITRNAVAPLQAAAPMVIRRLLDLLEFGGEHFVQQISRAETAQCLGGAASYPSSWVLWRYVAHQLVRSVKLRIEDRRRRRQWFIVVRSETQNFTRAREQFTAAGLRRTQPTEGFQEADPFVMGWKGRNFIFYEAICKATRRGCISCREINADLTLSEPVRVIDQPYHMSYPFVFQAMGQIYMLPESSANRTVELYRATEFPYKWTLERVLLNDVALVDTTPFFLDGIWYFFTTASETGEALLYYADRFDGEWHYHRRNPICSDIRRARGAGALFYRGGRLIRPAQDCSVRYGYAIRLNEVSVLTPKDYSEQLVETITPTWEDNLLRTHTLNSNGSLEVLDAFGYVDAAV